MNQATAHFRWSLRRATGVVVLFAAAAGCLAFAVCGAAFGAPAILGDAGNEPGRLLTYNVRVVTAGVAALGAACGTVGAFLVLRRKALLGDALSHATLPGIAGAFLLGTAMGWGGKSAPLLTAGAALAALAGAGLIQSIRRLTPLSDDAALAIVLSVFFGLGVSMLGLIQQMDGASAAGLESYILGRAAAMRAADGWRIAATAAAIAGVVALVFKELRALCFDPNFAHVQGWPVRLLDALLMTAAAAVTIVGLQAVGLILVVALLVIPAAAARCWSDSLAPMVWISAGFGAVSGAAGALWSAVAPDWPTGAVVVLAAAAIFFASLVCGASRGLLVRALQQMRFERRIWQEHALRTLWEAEEHAGGAVRMAVSDFREIRGGSSRRIRSVLERLGREGAVERIGDRWGLTPAGRRSAERVVRLHRLWEYFLVRHASVAPDHADRTADELEHLLSPDMASELEHALENRQHGATPPSPHPLKPGARQE
ncbi:MAG: metal ABC transporter permease [Kiritimatiellae bacterium]|nr:metal ABC transporter permease [Kiritimatiellia bacterium]MDW8458259.1 metal ABC transporter permease [Verrucomicrobiota bacterium]